MMADYGARWNYGTTDRRSPKRARRDYDRGYDERSAWGSREADQLTVTSELMRNGLAYGGLSSDLAISAVSSGMGLGVAGAASLSALGAGLAALDDPTLVSQTSQMMGYDVGNLAGRSNMNMNSALDVLPPDASSTLFVDGLPSDCSRREAAHIFRPFIGFKEVRLVHKDAKRGVNGEKLTLCFVEFADAKCAATALEALQGYKFDENDSDSYVLRLTFARYGPRGAPRARSPFRGRDISPFRRDRRR